MVKIYTRTGDTGTTSILGPGRVGKDDQRVQAYGTVDELQAVLGLARALAGDAEIGEIILGLQQSLFVVGQDLASPVEQGDRFQRVAAADIQNLEHLIDRLDSELPPLRRFVIPGHDPASAALHVARTVARRAEREIVALSRQTPVNPQLLAYINRLSDLLFVLARTAARRAGAAED